MKNSKKRILAVASSGGHWVQLMRIQESFNHHNTHFITTMDGYESMHDKDISVVHDSSRKQKIKLIVMTIQLAKIIVMFRPHVVITTGAAPGLVAILLGKLTGSKTIWVDSIANVCSLSLSGKIALKISDMTLTQWKHLVGDNSKLKYWGRVI